MESADAHSDETHLLDQLQTLYTQLHELRSSSSAPHFRSSSQQLSAALPLPPRHTLLCVTKPLGFRLPEDMPVTVITPNLVAEIREFEEKQASLSTHHFCSACLWPLFHSIPSHFQDTLLSPKLADYYLDYTRENQDVLEQCAAVIANCVQNGGEMPDVLVFDYELMLLPHLLRRRFPELSCCFFLSVPFPSSEFFNMLPMRQELLRGVLGADLVAFNHFDYVQHFLSACTHVLGLETSPSRIAFEGRLVTLGIVPLGVHPRDFEPEGDAVQRHIRRLHHKLGRKVIISVDRLDICSGIPMKLLAFETLLAEHPEHRTDATLYLLLQNESQVAHSPLERSLNQLVGSLNGRYGSTDHCPVRYIRRPLPREELAALYALADVALVTSLREGINLRAMEFVLCQRYRHEGVLVYSEFAGCASSLKGAVVVNPYDAQEVATAMHNAFTMSATTKKVRHHQLLQYATQYTSGAWAERLRLELSRASESARESKSAHLELGDIKSFWERSSQRLVILDLENTLIGYEALKEMVRVPSEVLDVLLDLCQDAKNKVYVCSSRTSADLLRWVGNIPGLGLIAENGFEVRFALDEPHPLALGLGPGAGVPPPPRSDDSPSARSGVGLDLGEETGEKASQTLMQQLQSLVGVDAAPSAEAQIGENGSGSATPLAAPGGLRRGFHVDLTWRPRVLQILRGATQATPGSLLEAGEAMLTWHFRDADSDFGLMRAKQLQLLFDRVLGGAPVRTQLLLGRKCLIVSPTSVSRARTYHRLLREAHPNTVFDCVVMACDGRATEDQYFDAAKGAHVFTVTVARAVSRAQYYVDDVEEMVKTLQALSSIGQNADSAGQG